MPPAVSARILEAIDALPLHQGVRVLEIGCGPGVAAREIVRRVPSAFVLGIDRSVTAIRQAVAGSAKQLALQQLAFRVAAIEAFALQEGEGPFHLAFALRVSAFDARHPKIGQLALPRVAAALAPKGRFFVDGGSPLREVHISAP